MNCECEIFDEVAYVYDGSLEGLLSAIFASYERRENPTDVVKEGTLQPRLSQRISLIETNIEHAHRVQTGIRDKCGRFAYRCILKASLSSEPNAGTYAYRFVRYALSVRNKKGRAINDISNPEVRGLHEVCVSIDSECEKIRQFARFEHLQNEEENMSIWFAKVNPKHSVVPLVMSHFIERFSIQSFILFDENHNIAGVYDGKKDYLVNTEGINLSENMPSATANEVQMQQAWRKFYEAVAIDSRFNPELRQHFMPKRFWKNITEMKEDVPALAKR